MKHIVLLGDSIFDNASYVAGGPDVITHLRGQLPSGWEATLRAVDGDVVGDVPRQLQGVPAAATHLVTSAGGNDALGEAGILTQSATSVADVLGRLAGVVGRFEKNYRTVLDTVLQRQLPTAVCTIYNPRFPDPTLQTIAVAALALFNDAIIRSAVQAGVPVIDLRLICNEYGDYANDIEPSVAGGAKIARGIHTLVTQHDFSTRRSAIYI